jgi:predicted RNA-binding Zn-ribbon protein involved in translation (DUF1610 family)
MGYTCPACGEALPNDTLCPCSMDDGPGDLFFRKQWPEQLEFAMCCQGCGATVQWRECKDVRTGKFMCPECGHVRPNHNVGRKLRVRVAERYTWTCHRCGLPIDPTLSWPHPLAATTDHYPVSGNDGGPPILANLKITHSLCNGSHGPVSGWRQVSTGYRLTDAEQIMIESIVKLPRDGSDHIQHGANRGQTRSGRARRPII